MLNAITEFRHALYRLGRTPLFALAASLTLSLAIGANATVFALVDRVVLNPLPYPQSDRLLDLDHGSRVLNLSGGIGLTSGLYFQYTRARTLAAVAIYRAGDSTIVDGDRAERIQIVRTTPSLIAALGVPPAVGRWFSDVEAAPGGPAVAVLSYGLWVRRFGADPRVVERTVTLDGVPTQIIGVMPASFAFPDTWTDLWTPARISRAMGFAVPFGYDGVARMRPGVTVERARAELNTLIADLPNAYPGDAAVLGNVGGGFRSVAVPLKESMLGSVASGLWVLLAAMGLLLLVACANIGNLVLVRADGRQREVAVRRAMGANRADIARLFLSESTVLAAIGAAGGLSIAWMALRALVGIEPATLPRLHEVELDATTVAFTVVLSLVAGLAFGMIPVLRALTFGSGLGESGRGQTASRRQHRTRDALMARSYERLRGVDTGFVPASVLTFRIGLPERDYPTRAAAMVAHRAILERLEHAPGVVAVSASTGIPLAETCFGNAILMRGESVPGLATAGATARLCAVSEGYVSAMRMRLVHGRDLARADVDGSRTNVLVNEAFVDTLLHGAEPLGRQFRSSAPPPPSARSVGGAFEWDGAPPWLTIVGVVSNTPFNTLTPPRPVPVVYMPLSIAGGPDIPSRALIGPPIGALTYVVRTSVSPATLTPAAQRAVQSVDRSLAMASVHTLQEIVDRASAQMAFTMALLIIAGAVALAIGLIGIYGVIAYVVSQRRSEIGVRLALGAAPGAVVAMIVTQGAIVALSGAVVGLVAAIALSGVMRSLLFGVSPRDPAVFATVGIALAAVTVVACWIPARRAARVNPTEALRAE
jgi:predicted permease